jgi:ABC-type transport system involved in cytochrome bd biosynthesis fused ATPase/permease subunit
LALLSHFFEPERWGSLIEEQLRAGISLDSCSRALDETSERMVLKALQELRDLGKMVILVAHDSRFIPFADRVYTVKNGSIEQASLVASPLLNF